ncbi:wax ester/triacylglycerol synthase domain-containing protein [Kitasatospora griseola]|uniref:wax ester/triacylglycerol synthase domain-containing protein n=1 Tax=Kitasatospora griseola TaxID=2064 RepID=UPI0038557ED9
MDQVFLGLSPGLIAGFVLEFTGRLPEAAALREHLRERAAELPALGLTFPDSAKSRRWSAAAQAASVDFSHRPDLADEDALRVAVTELFDRPFPAEPAPQWDLLFLSGYDAQRFTVIYRANHALQDGVGMIQNLQALLGDPRDEPLGLRPRRRPTARAVVNIARDVRATREGPAADAAGGSPTPLRWHFRDLDRSHLAAAAESRGVTVNDLCLATLARAVRAVGMRHPTLLVPMSTRRPSERYTPGNFTAGYLLRIPTGNPLSPDDALRSVRRQAGNARRTNERDTRRAVLAGLPNALARRAARPVIVNVGLTASSATLPHLEIGDARLIGAAMAHSAPSSLALDAYVSFATTGTTVRCSVFHRKNLPGELLVETARNLFLGLHQHEPSRALRLGM